MKFIVEWESHKFVGGYTAASGHTSPFGMKLFFFLNSSGNIKSKIQLPKLRSILNFQQNPNFCAYIHQQYYSQNVLKSEKR